MNGENLEAQHEELSEEGRGSLSSLISTEDWRERIQTFNLSWFVISMGTGAVTQVLCNFPYPAQWLYNLGYCFWILCILSFSLFTALWAMKSIILPRSFKEIFSEFPQVSYVGAFVITFDNIITGIIFYYNDHITAIRAAYGLFWVAVALTIVVGCAAVLVSCCYQHPHDISEVSGVWLVSFIPFIVTSAVGGVLVNYLDNTNQQITLTVSFLSWSLGQALCCTLLCIYFWRLLTSSLPARDLIISCFVPMGPTGEGAYSIQNLAVGLGTYVQKNSYILSRGAHKQATVAEAVAESVHWLGVIIALFLVAFSTFWLIQASGSVILRVPKRFSVGIWSIVFPFAVYTNALCRLAQDLDNPGFRGWAATCATMTVLLWFGCALTTVWSGLWKERWFLVPGWKGRKENMRERKHDGGDV